MVKICSVPGCQISGCPHLNTGCCLQAAYARERDQRLDLEAELSVMRSQLATFRSQVAEARITAGKKGRRMLTTALCFWALTHPTSSFNLHCWLGESWVARVGGKGTTAAMELLRRHSIQLPTQRQLWMHMCLML